MADHVIVAARRADALHRFDAEALKLSQRLRIKFPDSVPQEINRDAELRRVCDLERVVGFLHEVNVVLEDYTVAELVSGEAVILELSPTESAPLPQEEPAEPTEDDGATGDPAKPPKSKSKKSGS